MLLNERGADDAVAGRKRRAVVGRGRSKAAVEIDLPPASHGCFARCAAAALDLLQRGLAQASSNGAAQADDLGRLVRCRRAVTARMRGIERLLDRGSILLLKQPQRQIYGYSMLLADIAHVGRPLERNAAGFGRSAGDRVPTLVFQLAVHRLDLIEARIAQSCEAGSHEVV